MWWVSRNFPHRLPIMPFFNMFKPKQSRSRLSPSPSERFSDDSELYDQVPMYGSRSNGISGSSHTAPVHRSQLHASSRTRQYPRHGSTIRGHGSGPERYAQPEPQDQVRHAFATPHPTFMDP